MSDLPAPAGSGAELVRDLMAAGMHRGAWLGLALHPVLGVAVSTGCSTGDRRWCWPPARLSVAVAALAQVERALRPRWVWWSSAGTATELVRAGLRPATCWDLAAVHRVLAGGSQDGPGLVWALARGLDAADVPRTGQLDLLQPPPSANPTHAAEGAASSGVGADQPVDATGHVRAEWVDGGWARTPERMARWAELAVASAQLQRDLLVQRGRLPTVCGDPVLTAHAESTAALLSVELAQDGLPVDVARAQELICAAAGPRPGDAAHAARLRRERDDVVLAHLSDAVGVRPDLRNPAQVRAALARVGIDVPDTRSWRLEPWCAHHPLVPALLAWRKADRIATTYGYSWLDQYVVDGRLRGPWQASDGAAGRMTAGAGLHNLPHELRSAVAAEPGYVLVRADLGQIEPRVLAAVSADAALRAATVDDDLYAPVAARLRVERAVAKVAVLAAMYGQTSGAAGEALKGLDSAYPVAMAYLRAASDRGWAGQAVYTHGGRRVPMWQSVGGDGAQRGSVDAARGRFARNAVVQGAAAELFKAWAVTVRPGLAALDSQVVLCLHDELLVHVPVERADAVVALLRRDLDRVGQLWGARVRLVVDVRVVHRWSQAKQ